MVLVPGAETAHGSLRFDSRTLVAGPVWLLLSFSLLFCCRCLSVSAAALLTSLLFRRRCCFLVVAAAPSSSPLLSRRRRCSLVVAASVAALLSLLLLLRVPWTFGIFGSLGMPFLRGRYLIHVSRPIGSPPRHTPGRICFSLLGGRIRTRRAYLPHRTRPRSRSPLASKHLHAYAPQDLWWARGLGVASPLTPGDTLCIRPSA